MSSKITKEISAKYWVLKSIDLIILWCPLIIYFFIAMADGGVTTLRKAGLVGTVVIAIILTIFNIITRHHLRSPLWIVLIGLYCAVDYLLPLIIIIAVATCLDEFVLQPLVKKYKTQLEASRVYDKHNPKEGE